MDSQPYSQPMCITAGLNIGDDILPNNMGSFRVCNQRLFLTYKDHQDKLKIREFIISLTKSKAFKFFAIAHESGKTETYDHTHILIDFGYKFETTSQRKFDFNGIHPNIKKVLTHEHWWNSIKYLCKEDPDNEDLLKTIPLITKLWGQSSLSDALFFAKKPSDITGIRSAMECKTLPPVQVIEPKLPWQKDVVGYTRGKPDPRHIRWICDERGNTGKSSLAKYLMVTYPNDYLCLTDVGSSSNLATIVKDARLSGWSGHCIMVDLPRDFQDNGIYRALEKIKNGNITAQKYHGGPVVFDIPHVIVFANRMPDRSVARWSEDRWGPGVWKINPSNMKLYIEGKEECDVIVLEKKVIIEETEKTKVIEKDNDEIEILKQQVITQAEALNNALSKISDLEVDSDEKNMKIKGFIEENDRLRAERNQWKFENLKKDKDLKESKDQVMELQNKLQALESQITRSSRLKEIRSPDYLRVSKR